MNNEELIVKNINMAKPDRGVHCTSAQTRMQCKRYYPNCSCNYNHHNANTSRGCIKPNAR